MNTNKIAAEAIDEARSRTGINFDEQEAETLQAIIKAACEKAYALGMNKVLIARTTASDLWTDTPVCAKR